MCHHFLTQEPQPLGILGDHTAVTESQTCWGWRAPLETSQSSPLSLPALAPRLPQPLPPPMEDHLGMANTGSPGLSSGTSTQIPFQNCGSLNCTTSTFSEFCSTPHHPTWHTQGLVVPSCPQLPPTTSQLTIKWTPLEPFPLSLRRNSEVHEDVFSYLLHPAF